MTGRFRVDECDIPGVYVLQRDRLADERGYLERMFCTDDLGDLLEGSDIVQINHTLTKKAGMVRGLHFQYPPFAEKKFVSCISGEVFDVAVDLRKDSPTFLHWHAELLTDANGKTLFIPEGFAHGFQTLTDDCELLYLHTAPYSAESEGGLNATDEQIGIRWPKAIAGQSERDATLPTVNHEFAGIDL